MKVKVYFGKTMYDVLGIGVEPIGGKPVPECNAKVIEVLKQALEKFI